MKVIEYLKLVTQPKQTFRQIADADNGNLLRQSDFLFLIIAFIKGLEVLGNQVVWESSIWEKGLAIILMIIGSYIIARYLFSFLIYKISSIFNSAAEITQIRFIYSHSYIPMIGLSLFTVIRTLLIIFRSDNMVIIYLQYYSSLIGFGLLIFVMVAGLMELMKLKMWQAILSTSPIFAIFLLTLLNK